MPTHAGWKVHYFSVADFEREPSTPYETLPDALAAVGDHLPKINTEETRKTAGLLEELLWLQLEDRPRSGED